MCSTQRDEIMENLGQETVEHDDIGIAFADGGENPAAILGPGDSPRYKSTPVTEIRKGSGLPVFRGEKPNVRPEAIVQRHGQPFSIL